MRTKRRDEERRGGISKSGGRTWGREGDGRQRRKLEGMGKRMKIRTQKRGLGSYIFRRHNQNSG